MASENIPLSYKGHPLRRKDNLIYYGTMAEKYIVMLRILSTKKVDGLEMADKVDVQLQLTDPDLKSRDRVVKKSEKDSLYAAMDVASVWLDSYHNNSQRTTLHSYCPQPLSPLTSLLKSCQYNRQAIVKLKLFLLETKFNKQTRQRKKWRK